MKNPIYLMSAMAIALVGSVALVMFYDPPAVSQIAEKLNASHILIKYDTVDQTGETERTREEALELAAEVYEKATKQDADFAELARTYSEDTSAKDGGRLGNFTPETMIPEFSEATINLQIGGISEPIESQFGFHIIRRTELD